jgi:HSP20 family protein
MLAIRSPLLTDFALDEPFRALLDTALHGASPDLRAFTPAADVRETDEAYLLDLDIPGLSEKELEVVIEHNHLTLRGERKPLEGAGFTRQERAFGRFERTFHLADDVDATRIDAHAKNGVLTVTLPKAEKAKARTIAVKSE